MSLTINCNNEGEVIEFSPQSATKKTVFKSNVIQRLINRTEELPIWQKKSR